MGGRSRPAHQGRPASGGRESLAAVVRSDGPAREGSTYEEINPIVGPWRAKTRRTVIEFDSPRRQVHRSEDIPFASEFLVIIEIAPSGDGSEVTFTLRDILGAGSEHPLSLEEPDA